MSNSNFVVREIHKHGSSQVPVVFSTFPGGEEYVRVGQEGYYDSAPRVPSIEIAAFLTSSQDFMRLILLVDVVKRLYHGSHIDLILPYIPYGRQDRVCKPGESLSIKVVANILNGLGVRKIVTIDPHSDVTGALIENLEVIPSIRFPESQYTVIHPDAGAAKKWQGLYTNSIQAYKAREDGKVTTTGLSRIPDKKERLIVVDDICDGGATFIALGDYIKERCPDNVLELYVTHGIFSKGVDELLKIYDEIKCCHAFGKDIWTGRVGKVNVSYQNIENFL